MLDWRGADRGGGSAAGLNYRCLAMLGAPDGCGCRAFLLQCGELRDGPGHRRQGDRSNGRSGGFAPRQGKYNHRLDG